MAILSTSTGAHAAGTAPWAGCASGNVCLYAQDRHDAIGDNDITNAYHTYGTYNLHNLSGMHWLLNNQIDGARVKLRTGLNGTGDCSDVIEAQHGEWRDFTPITSVVLYP